MKNFGLPKNPKTYFFFKYFYNYKMFITLWKPQMKRSIYDLIINQAPALLHSQKREMKTTFNIKLSQSVHKYIFNKIVERAIHVPPDGNCLESPSSPPTWPTFLLPPPGEGGSLDFRSET